MLVSWNWLKEYVPLAMTIEELTDRLTMSGLNLEEITPQGDDTCIDLEVTSNRPDCLGHLGVAREISTLFDVPLKTPAAKVAESKDKVTDATEVVNENIDLCPRYIARVMKGVKIGPSPDWLRDRLATIGQPSVNNVVDVTNYVLMECGQPLHAFDLALLAGKKIIVREAKQDETITAIDQREYKLDAGTCVIADAEKPVAIAGVMGGLDTEISEKTANILIETAAFQPMSVRNTARQLNLHSPSSYRFERGVDLEQLDWASRRCCELILEVAGGELLEGSIVAGEEASPPRPEITLRYNQVPRVLGIPVSGDECEKILLSLGLEKTKGDAESGQYVPPSWRRDLTRECDLIEEVARIHGYEKIPTNAAIPVTASSMSRADRVTDKVRDTLISLSIYEAITLTFVSQEMDAMWDAGTDSLPLSVDHSSRRQENLLRRSLIPSLLQWRRENEKHSVFNACLFEISKIFLSNDKSLSENEAEPRTIGIVGGWEFRDLLGILESLAQRINRAVEIKVEPASGKQWTEGRAATLFLNDRQWGTCGEIARELQDKLDLRDRVCAAELNLSVLEELADLTPTFQSLPQYPAIERDLNFVLPEATTWAELESIVREAAGELLESVSFRDQYRGKQIDADKKSYVMTLSFRSTERTLTSEEVDRAQQNVIAACERELTAALR